MLTTQEGTRFDDVSICLTGPAPFTYELRALATHMRTEPMRIPAYSLFGLEVICQYTCAHLCTTSYT